MANVKIRASVIYRYFYYLLILGLIFFGHGFSKFHVIGPLYLHDLILLIATLAVLIRPPAKLPFLPVLIVSAISLLYLIASLFTSTAPITIIIRQYAIFGYMICYYLLYLKSFRGPDHELAVKFLIRTGILCLLIQTIFIIYRIANGLSVLADYNYFSPITVLGIIIAATYFIVFIDNLFYKVCLFGVALLLSLSTGHSSAFLSVFTVGAFYIFFRSTHFSKMVIIALIVGAVFSLYIFLPQFQDVNAGWRLITWEYTLRNMVTQNFGLIGEGFGVPYFDDYLIDKLFREVGGTGFYGPSKVDEPYLSSVHNSYLTICFSIGLLPGLLILYPFYKMFQYLATRRYWGSNEFDFLFLSLIGLSVWVSFNQILEVPHSTGLFWLVYFACLTRGNRSQGKISRSGPAHNENG